LMKRLRKQNRQIHRRDAGSTGERPAAQS
jgi:hypothetical protein